MTVLLSLYPHMTHCFVIQIMIEIRINNEGFFPFENSFFQVDRGKIWQMLSFLQCQILLFLLLVF